MTEDKQEVEDMDIEDLESEVKPEDPPSVDQEFLENDEDDFAGLDIDALIPTMTVNKNAVVEEPVECMVDEEDLWGIYGEIMENCRKDRKDVDGVLVNFIDMVMNEGDASSASKEAIVNLLKIKSDSSDKMSKVADLMTRIKLKEKDTYPRYLNAQQNNKVVIEGSKREMIKTINKMAAKNKLSGQKGGGQ